MTLKITPTDEKKQEEGAWTKYLHVECRIARSTKPSYVAEVARRMKVFRNNKQSNNAIDVIDESCHALANHILLEWKPFEVKGETINYSRETAYQILKNDPDFREFVVDFADDISNFYETEVEEVVGKSTDQ